MNRAGPGRRASTCAATPTRVSVSARDPVPGLVVVIDGRYLTDHYPGIGRYLFNLCAALPAAAPTWRFRLLVDRRAVQTRFDLELVAARGVDIVPADVSVRSARGQASMAQMCRRLSADVFHAPHLLSARRLPCPTLVTIYDVIPLHRVGRLPTLWHRMMYRVLLRRALRSATGVVVLSDAAAEDLAARCDVARDRVSVTPAAADPCFKPTSPAATTQLRARLELPDRYALYVGTNKPHKNLPRLVDAWARLTGGAGDKTCLVIAGPEDARHPETRRRAAAVAPHSVRFVGSVPEADLPALYTGARLFVQPSLCEGFGLPVLEAMACGVPVVCARNPALDEVTGRAAHQFDPMNIEGLTDALRRGRDDDALRAELVTRGFARVREFSWPQTATLTVDAYARVTGHHVRGDRQS